MREWDKKLWRALLSGDKAAWDAFVERFAPVVFAGVRRRLLLAGREAEAEDVVQDVFVKLCARDNHLLRRYDPAKAKLTTYLTVVATSTALDHLRRDKGHQWPLDAVPEKDLAEAPAERPWVKIPPGLLSARQELVLELLYQRDLDPAEAAAAMGVAAQTVRSMHHKAIEKLRAHFRPEDF